MPSPIEIWQIEVESRLTGQHKFQAKVGSPIEHFPKYLLDARKHYSLIAQLSLIDGILRHADKIMREHDIGKIVLRHHFYNVLQAVFKGPTLNEEDVSRILQDMVRKQPVRVRKFREEMVANIGKTIHREKSTIQGRVENIFWYFMGLTLKKTIMKNRVDALYLQFTPTPIIRECWKQKKLPTSLLREMRMFGTSVDFVFALRLAVDHDTRRRTYAGDFPDLLHASFLPYVDVFTCDNSHGQGIKYISTKLKNDWFKSLASKIIPSSNDSIHRVISLINSG